MKRHHLLLTAGLFAAACTSDADSARPLGIATSTPTSVIVEESTTTTSIAAIEEPDEVTTTTVEPDTTDLTGAEIALEVIAEADEPIFLTQRFGSDLLTVVERGGTVRLLDPATGELGAPIIDISDRTTTNSERGLLSAAYSNDGTDLYLSYTDLDGHSVVMEYTLSGDRPIGDEQSGGIREVLYVEQPFSNHNGGQVVVGPDGLLYVGLGDGGSGGDPLGHGQDTTTLLGSMVRIDPSGRPYAIPDANPFAERGGAPEVLYPGLRNPWRFSFDLETGDLWIADVGQTSLEEVNVVSAALIDDGVRNFGWNVFEGTAEFASGDVADHHPPIFQYGRADGCSVTGGFVHRGPDLPALDGVYLFGDFCTSTLWGLATNDEGSVDYRDFDIAVPGASLGSFGQDLAGNVYALSLEGQISKVVAG